MRFGRFLAGKHHDLARTCRGKPTFPEPLPSAVDSFGTMEYGKDAELWAFADLQSVFRYLRGGKHLRIPAEWRDLIPRSFPAPGN